MSTAAGIDLLAFGEALVRLTPPGRELLETADAMRVGVAGAELNTAVGVARLGHRVAWLSRIPDNPLGRLVESRARAAGVDTTMVEHCGEERQALMFLEHGATPRPSRVTYDRRESAFARLEPGAIHWSDVLEGVRAFHTTAITMAISRNCHEAVVAGLQTARDAGSHTSLDLNFRRSLIEPERLARGIREVAPTVDLLIASVTDAAAVFNTGSDPAQAAARLADDLGIERVAISARVDLSGDRQSRRSALFWGGHVEVADSPAFETVDPLGGGDAFAAGLIDGVLRGDLRHGLHVGGALAALKQTIPGDFALVTESEIEATMGGTSMRTER